MSGRERLALGLLLLLLLFVRASAVRAPFFADDYFFLEQVHGRSLPVALASPDPLGNFLRPVGRQSWFWLMARLGHESPLVFHLGNLLLFLGGVLLLHRIARRLGGPLVAFVAAAYWGIHYAAGVPLLWASGSQDLLAVFLALATVELQCAGHLVPAAVTLVLALLAKESVALTAAIAIAASAVPSGKWRDAFRRGAGLLAVTAAWGAWWLLTLRQRPAAAQTLAIHLGDALAAFAHLVQVAFGLEFRAGTNTFGHWSLLAIVAGAAVGALTWFASTDVEAPRDQTGAIPSAVKSAAPGVGLAWALAGTLPVILVASIWSAYYYWFALAGVALVVGGVLAARPRTQRAVWLGVLACLLANAGGLDEFATTRGAWTWQSHVNRHYLERAMKTNDRYLHQLRAARPALPPRSTVFFADVPASLGWQAGDGPLVRWAYRDSSLRSYFLTQFTRERAARGPMFFFAAVGDTLVDRSNDPLLLPSFAYSMILADRPQAALDVLNLALAHDPASRELHYWRAWTRWALGDTAGGRADLASTGVTSQRLLVRPALPPAAAPFDTSARLLELRTLRDRASLDSWVHARLGALALATAGGRREGVIEAFAYRVLAPADPDAWRKWASAQLAEAQYEPALRSLDHYLRLAGPAGAADAEAQGVRRSLAQLVGEDRAHPASESVPQD